MDKNRIRFLIILLVFFSNFLFAQQRNLWSRINESDVNDALSGSKIMVKKHKSFNLELIDFKNELKGAPIKGESSGKSFKKVFFPDAMGQLVSYLVKEAPVMHPELAKKFPDNKSYVGVSEKDASKRIRFSVNKLGLNGVIMDTNGGVQYIQPVSKDQKKYQVFYRNDLMVEKEFQCLTNELGNGMKSNLGFKFTDDGKIRTYRLALAGTGEYAQFHIEEQNAQGATDEEKKEIVLAAMSTAITRINAVFENDLAITLQLVPNNDELIFLDPDTDPYDNLDSVKMLDQNQTTCDNVIGTSNYDLGHAFSTEAGSGVATLSSACRNGVKARGVTGDSSPVGNGFYFDYVAHELGHQFGARHTFNGDQGSCGQNGQRIPETAIEPGSGSTLMAYAGLCSPQNVQSNSDLYFHVISIEEIRDYITTGSGNCAETTDLLFNNNPPVVDAGDDFTIPRGTPYKLVGSGSDADGDPISFTWEQTDNGVTAVPPSESSVTGALYRSYEPSSSAIRYMPQMNTLITGAVSSKWEVTPNVARTMNFALTVRDNNSEAGQTATDNIQVTVTDAAGPFLVSTQNMEDLVWTPNSKETISWDVAGTNSNGVNVSQVNILLSTDGGASFSTILASGIANDGSHEITVPDLKASKCFIMVEAVGNYFFALNAKSFSIGEFNEICTIYESTDTPLVIPDGDREGVSSVIQVPENVTVEGVKLYLIDKGDESSGTSDAPGIVHSYLSDLTITLESPEGTVLEMISSVCTALEDIQVLLTDEGAELICNNSSPSISGVRKPLEELSGFNQENAQGNWILKVVDDTDRDVGFLEAWSLEICSSEEVLDVNNYVFDNFSVFPNPSNGEFNIKFQSEDAGDVDVIVYDLLGRKIARKTYKGLSYNFEERINLENVSEGLYILSVKRGNKMSSQKIRIK